MTSLKLTNELTITNMNAEEKNEDKMDLVMTPNLSQRINEFNLFQLFQIFDFCSAPNVFMDDVVDIVVFFKQLQTLKEPLTKDTTTMMFRGCSKLRPNHYNQFASIMKILLRNSPLLILNVECIIDGFSAIKSFPKSNYIIELMMILAEKLKQSDCSLRPDQYAQVSSIIS